MTEEKKKRGPGNPKTSKWFATNQDGRRRKKLTVTVSDDVRERLQTLRVASGIPISRLVELLVMRPHAEIADILAGAATKEKSPG